MWFEQVLFFLAGASGRWPGRWGWSRCATPSTACSPWSCTWWRWPCSSCCCSAEFLAAAQVVVYAGAVMVLYIFVVAYIGGARRAAATRGGGLVTSFGPLFAVAHRARAVHRAHRHRPRGARHTRADVAPGFGAPGRSGRCCCRLPRALRGRLLPAARGGGGRGGTGAPPARAGGGPTRSPARRPAPRRWRSGLTHRGHGGALVDITWFLVLSAFIFCIGAAGVLIRRDPLVVLLCLELMLNAGTWRWWPSRACTAARTGRCSR